MPSKLKTVAAITMLLTVAACAAPVTEINDVDDPSGFWWGLLHGLILVFSFIGSLFSDSITIYDVNNTGGWYDFGFLLGAGVLLGGSSNS